MALITPRLQVTMDDGTVHDVQTNNFDMVCWDKDRVSRRWPSMEDAPVLSGTYLAWHAMGRLGKTGLTFDQFCEQAIEVRPVEDDEPSEVDPTRPGAGPG